MDSPESNQQERQPLTNESDIAAAMQQFIAPEKPRDEKGKFVATKPQEEAAEAQPAEQPAEVSETAEEVEAFLEEQDLKKKARVKVQGEGAQRSPRAVPEGIGNRED
jgi:hypothetical protein